MELRSADVTIVSIRGRGHGLAAELKRRGLEVTVIDLTSQLGLWPAEDQEGPFGFFKSENFSTTFLESLHEEDPYQQLERGFTFWTAQGPLELKGPVTRYLLLKWGWKDEWIGALSHEKPSLQFFDHARGLGTLWPMAMAHVLAKTYDLKTVEAPLAERKLPLTADFSVRFSTRQGLEKSIQWLIQMGIQVFSKTQILDLSQENLARWDGFEFKGELSGIQKSPRFVWTLTSEETKFYSAKLFSKMYNDQVIEPLWCWVRYRGRLPDVPLVGVLPLHFVMIRDTDAPWTHDNLIITQRTSSRDQFDFWVKIPSLQRFNKEYLTQMWDKIIERWVDRHIQVSPSLVSHPQEYYYTYEELGPSPFPIFERKTWQKNRNNVPSKNARFHSPEQWDSHSWDSQFDVQQTIGQEIWNIWKQEQIRKEKRRDREIHSP
ncbi:MAG: hypothetical protein JNM39_02050 [Bdellovibrionaceae bacterium]|nr:hypothetical protein [Pseudobdellovibrionaceae bacterium]